MMLRQVSPAALLPWPWLVALLSIGTWTTALLVLIDQEVLYGICPDARFDFMACIPTDRLVKTSVSGGRKQDRIKSIPLPLLDLRHDVAKHQGA